MRVSTILGRRGGGVVVENMEKKKTSNYGDLKEIWMSAHKNKN